MLLTEIVPVVKIEALVGDLPLAVEPLNTSDGRTMADAAPGDIHAIAAYAWHRIVVGGRHGVDPQQMSSFFNPPGDPRFALAIGRVIQTQLIREFGLVTVRDASGFEVATSSVALLYDQDLHLHDLAMSDPRRPIGSGDAGYGSRGHHGFGLLGEVVDRLVVAATERGCRVISLTATTRYMVDVFGRHGFEVEDSTFGRSALAFGMTIPMHRPI